ncbi:MAG TPA: TIGR04282 family arsenosugar biosynthesis glycosyltransferase [Euzebyales bacterium]|nr:TIGR04282 family arsenosugar biosynthesis glycosyltransferase [Euzebyales bacterium]
MTVGTAIAVVAKAPVPGPVKTRMQPGLSADLAADLAAAMLADVTTAARATDATVWWSYAGDRAVLDALRPAGVRLLAQVGDGLGERLAHAHRTLHGAAAGRVLLVGADCPTVDADVLRAALARLDDHDVVLGPAGDGGYTLLGTGTCAPSLLSAVPMSTAHTGADTLAQAERLGLRTAVLDARPDLDTVDDLRTALDGGWLDAAPRTRALATSILGTRPTA